jgi:hypothetical protein
MKIIHFLRLNIAHEYPNLEARTENVPRNAKSEGKLP